jgi:hypothetical protein
MNQNLDNNDSQDMWNEDFAILYYKRMFSQHVAAMRKKAECKM